MNVISKPRMTLDEFLAWERQQELMHEFDGVRIIPMNGGPIAHYLIAYNLGRALEDLIDPARFMVIPAGVKLVWDGRVRYPDLVVAAAVADTTTDITPEPIVVFEVISPSSVTKDTVTKNLEYRSNPSIQQYVVLEQDAVAATVWEQSGKDWIGTLITGDAPLVFPSLGVTVPLSRAYARVTIRGDDDGAAIPSN